MDEAGVVHKQEGVQPMDEGVAVREQPDNKPRAGPNAPLPKRETGTGRKRNLRCLLFLVGVYLCVPAFLCARLLTVQSE